MKSDNGTLEFDATFNNEKLYQSVDEADKRVQGFVKNTVKGGEMIDDTFKITADNIKIQKDVIAKMEADVNNLNIEIAKMKPGAAQDKMKQDAKAVSAELKAEKDALKMLEGEMKQSEQTYVSSRTRMRQYTEELIRMREAGLQNTDQYRKLQAEAAEFGDTIKDVKGRITDLGNDERVFQGIIQGVSGITGGFSAAQGAVGLFAGENENLNKIMLKVQSLMAITIGLQQVAQTLNKDEAFMSVIVARAKDTLSAANIRLATTLGISTAAATALMAALTLGLSVAITGIVILLSKLSSKQAEAKKNQEEFNKAVADSAAEPVAAIHQLATEWNALGNNMKAKEQYFKSHTELFDKLGGSIKDVNDAERVLTSKETLQAFTSAMISRAKAMAAVEIAKEKYKEGLLKGLEADSIKNKTITVQSGGYMGMGAITTTKENPELTKIKKKQAEFDAAADALMQKSVEFTNQEKAIIKKIGLDSEKIVSGTIAAMEQSIASLEDQYKNAKTSKARKELFEQLTKERARLNKMDLSNTDGKSKGGESEFKIGLDKKKALYQQYFKWINSNDTILQNAAKTEFSGLLKEGTTYIGYLKAQRDKLLTDKSAVATTNLKEVNNAIAEETTKAVMQDFEDSLRAQMDSADSVIAKLKIISDMRKSISGSDALGATKNETLDSAEKDTQAQAEEQANQLLADYASFLSRKMKLQEDFNNDMILLQNKLSKATTADQQKAIQEAMDNRKKQFASDSKGSGDAEYDSLVAEYRNFEQKKQAIIDHFDEKRRKAVQMGNDELVRQLDEAQAQALSGLSLDELQNSEAFQNLFGNLDRLTVEKMIELRNQLEQQWAKLDLDPKELQAIRDQLEQVTQRIQEKNPFAALGDALKRLKKESEALDINKWMANPANAGKGVHEFDKANQSAKAGGQSAAFKDVAASIGSTMSQITAVFDQVTGSLDKMGITMDDQTKQVMNDVVGIVGGASDVAMGIASGNPLQIIQGAIGIISNGIDLIAGAKDRKLQKSIEKHAKQVQKLKEGYEALEKAVDKALGTDVFKAQKDQITNLSKQQKEYQAMLEAEQKKRKKKQDAAKIQEYKDGIKNTKDQMTEIVQSMKEAILQGDVKSIARELGSAIMDAFSAGEDAAQAWGDKVDEIVGNVIKNMIIQSAIEKPVGNIINSYMSKWVDANGNLLMTPDQIMKSASDMGKQLEGLGPSIEAILNSLPDNIKSYLTGGDSADKSPMTGAIQSITEESASILTGQVNAVRINQIESLNAIRASLMVLNQIQTNTAYNVNLVEILAVLKSMMQGSSLRAQGLG